MAASIRPPEPCPQAVFNTEGAVHCSRQYWFPPLARWDLQAILELIDQ